PDAFRAGAPARIRPRRPRAADLDLGIKLQDISFGIAEEKGAMPPARDIAGRTQDRDALGLQRLMTGIDHMGWNPEGELDRCRTGRDRPIIPREPRTPWLQRQQRRADLKAHPSFTVVGQRKAHDVTIELLGFLDS